MSPWEKRVLLYTASEPVPTAPPAVNPQPWGLVLADGSRCQIRNGGAWPGRADDYKRRLLLRRSHRVRARQQRSLRRPVPSNVDSQGRRVQRGQRHLHPTQDDASHHRLLRHDRLKRRHGLHRIQSRVRSKLSSSRKLTISCPRLRFRGGGDKVLDSGQVAQAQSAVPNRGSCGGRPPLRRLGQRWRAGNGHIGQGVHVVGQEGFRASEWQTRP